VAALLTVAVAGGQSIAPPAPGAGSSRQTRLTAPQPAGLPRDESPPPYVRPAVAYQPAMEKRPGGAVLPVQFTTVPDKVRESGELDAATPLRHAAEADPIKLRRRGDAAGEAANGRHVPAAAGSLVTVAASLAIVLGLFFVLVWITRKNMPRAMVGLSSQVVEVLGRAPLGQRQQMHLVRIGNKLLLVCVTPAGAHTLTEVTDPAQVDQLVALCRQDRSAGITHSFRNVLSRRNDAAAASADSPADGHAEFDAAFDHPRERAAAAWEDDHVA
jgi:flagellar biogenesis protein FliO